MSDIRNLSLVKIMVKGTTFTLLVVAAGGGGDGGVGGGASLQLCAGKHRVCSLPRLREARPSDLNIPNTGFVQGFGRHPYFLF